MNAVTEMTNLLVFTENAANKVKQLIDEEGNRVSENEADFKNLSRAVAGELFSRCQDLNAYGKAEIEDIVKKSEEAES